MSIYSSDDEVITRSWCQIDDIKIAERLKVTCQKDLGFRISVDDAREDSLSCALEVMRLNDHATGAYDREKSIKSTFDMGFPTHLFSQDSISLFTLYAEINKEGQIKDIVKNGISATLLENGLLELDYDEDSNEVVFTIILFHETPKRFESETRFKLSELSEYLLVRTKH